MKNLPLVRKYHPSIVNTDLDVYKVKEKIKTAALNIEPDPFQITDKLGSPRINETKIKIVVYNSRGLFYII